MESKSGETPPPAPLSLRMVAFTMDCILVFFVACTVLQLSFPNEKASVKSTWANDYRDEWRELKESHQQGSQTAEAELVEKLEVFLQEPSVLEFLDALISCMFWSGFAYWFAGERFFAGSSLGKRMFSLASLDLRDNQPPRTGVCLLRAFLKSTSMLPLFLTINFLLTLFNRRHMAGHDYVCRTLVVRLQLPRKKQEESTIYPP